MVAAPLSTPVRIEPPTLAEQVSEKWLTELKKDFRFKIDLKKLRAAYKKDENL